MVAATPLGAVGGCRAKAGGVGKGQAVGGQRQEGDSLGGALLLGTAAKTCGTTDKR